MTDFSLVPVDHQPDFDDHSLVPVDHDPFSADDMIQQARMQLESQPQRLNTGADLPDVGVPAINPQAAPSDASHNPDSASGDVLDRIAAYDPLMPRSGGRRGDGIRHDSTGARNNEADSQSERDASDD